MESFRTVLGPPFSKLIETLSLRTVSLLSMGFTQGLQGKKNFSGLLPYSVGGLTKSEDCEDENTDPRPSLQLSSDLFSALAPLYTCPAQGFSLLSGKYAPVKVLEIYPHPHAPRTLDLLEDFRKRRRELFVMAELQA